MEPNFKLPVPLRAEKHLDRKLDFLLGQKNVPIWEGSRFVETLFNLYLFKKYKHNCIVSTYNKNGNNIGIILRIHLDVNVKQYERNAQQIVNCIKKGNNNIIIPLYINSSDWGHANILLYRKNQNVIEHFEPHGAAYSVNDTNINSIIDGKLSRIIDIINETLEKNNLEKVTLIKSNLVCPRISGLQNLEAKSKLVKGGKGYCVAWSMFFTELALKNPSLSSNQLLQLIFNKLDKMKPLERHDYLRRVITGYSNLIHEKIIKYFEFLLPKNVPLGKLNEYKNNKTISSNYLNIHTDLLIDIHVEFMNDPTLTKTKYIQQLNQRLKRLKQSEKDEIININRKLDILKKYDALENISPESSYVSDKNLILKPCPTGQERNVVTNRCRNPPQPQPQHQYSFSSSPSIPSSFTPPSVEDINPIPCPPGKERNPLTNRCRKIANATRKANPKEPQVQELKPCPPGQVRNPVTRRCRKIVADANTNTRKKVKKNGLKPCKEGQIRNPATNRCKKL